MSFRTLLPAALVAAAFLTFTAPAQACPGCGPPSGQTLASEVAQADFILYGTLGNPKANPADPAKGTTDLTIETVVKTHALVKDKKVFVIPRLVPPDTKPTKYMVFFNVVNGDVDPYRGVAVTPDSKLPDYVKGALEAKKKDTVTRLRYFFDNLESPDLEISGDAYNEFAYAEYKEVKELAPTLPTDTLLKWLKDKDTRPSRLGLYGLLLGHATADKDRVAKEVRKLLGDPDRKFSSGLDGMMMGYTILDPKGGYEFLTKLVADPEKEFLEKHAGLKVLRFFWEYRKDVLTRKQLLDGVLALMAHPDIADMPVDDLRKWKAWELTPQVLHLATLETHNTLPIVKRSILKYALAASWDDPKNTAAVAFVVQARKDDPDRVKLLEDLLKDEMKAAPKPPEAKK